MLVILIFIGKETKESTLTLIGPYSRWFEDVAKIGVVYGILVPQHTVIRRSLVS